MILPGFGIYRIELKDGAASVKVAELIERKRAFLVGAFLGEPVNPKSNAWFGITVGHPPLVMFAGHAARWTTQRNLTASGEIQGVAVGPLIEIKLRNFEQKSVQLCLQWIEERDGE